MPELSPALLIAALAAIAVLLSVLVIRGNRRAATPATMYLHHEAIRGHQGRSRSRTLLTTIVGLFVVWQVWQKVHIVYWAHMPWWALPVGVLVFIILFDLAIGRASGD
jgi:hypothetical protein